MTMKWTICAFVLCGVILAVPGSALAGSGNKYVADADFASTDPSGCVSTEVKVIVAVEEGRANSETQIRIDETDDCRDAEILQAHASVPLNAGEVQFDPQLEFAFVDATVKMFDDVSKRHLGIKVNLRWDVDAESLVTREEHLKTDGRRNGGETVRRTFGMATAYGTLSDGKKNYIPEPATDATIGLIERSRP